MVPQPLGHKAGVTWLIFIYLVDSDSLEGSYTHQGDLFLPLQWYPLPPHVWHDLLLNDIPLGRRPKGRLRDVHPEDEDEGVSDKQLATSMSVFMDTQIPCFADHWSYTSSTTMILDGRYNYNIIYRFDTILDLQGWHHSIWWKMMWKVKDTYMILQLGLSKGKIILVVQPKSWHEV